MNITPLLNSLSRIPDVSTTGGPLSLTRLSNARAALKTDPASGAGTTAGTPSATAVPGAGLANESVFLQLLVAQLKNQDPQNPADGTSFVTQLAQFTTLEQDTQSTQDLNQILTLLQATSATGKGATGASPSTPTAPVPGTPVSGTSGA
jgi:flagellar basal-body rod modification protein FlgD